MNNINIYDEIEKNNILKESIKYCKTGQLDSFILLKNNNPSIVWNKDEIIQKAIINGHLEVVSFLYDNLIDNFKNYKSKKDNDEIFFRIAAENGHLHIVKFFVSKGVDIHYSKDYGLRYSAKNGHLDVVKFFVENGCSVTIKNNRALQQSCENGHLNIAIYLMQNGASPESENYHSLTSAAQNKHINIMDYFYSLGYTKEFYKKCKDKETLQFVDLWYLNKNLETNLDYKLIKKTHKI